MLPKVLQKVRQNRLRTSVLIIVGVIVALGLADFLTGIHQLSAYDTKWNGISKFRSALGSDGYDTSAIISTPLLLNSSEGFPAVGEVLVVIGVERPYLPAELDTIEDFVARGGFLLLADDFGYGNALATRLGFAFSGMRIYSSVFDRNPAFIVVNATLGGTGYRLLLDKPTALDRVATSQIKAQTDQDTWMDENGNGERDIDEESGSYPVVALIGHGDGYVLAVSDSGLFINDLWDRAGNAGFVLAAVKAFFPEAREFIFDETRHKPETIREGAWSTGLFLEVLVLDNIFGKVAFGILALLAVGIGIVSVKTPAEWRHEDTLSEITLHHMARGMYRAEDRDRLRAALLEKVRISLGLYPDEFEQMDADLLRDEIGDERLFVLVEDPGKVRMEQMEELTARVRAWYRR
jgi:hypothetical protein